MSKINIRPSKIGGRLAPVGSIAQSIDIDAEALTLVELPVFFQPNAIVNVTVEALELGEPSVAVDAQQSASALPISENLVADYDIIDEVSIIPRSALPVTEGLVGDWDIITSEESITYVPSGGGGENPVAFPSYPGTIRIMLFGDSLTNDSRGRVQLHDLLTADGVPVDYVGSQTQSAGLTDPDGNNDAEHEGVGGRKVEEGTAYLLDTSVDLINTWQPHIVCILLGTNNVFEIAWGNDSGAQDIIDSYQTLINTLQSQSAPDTTIVCSTIPPMDVGPASGIDRVALVEEFNTLLKDIVQVRINNGEYIAVSDLFALVDPATELASDGVHLNSLGYLEYGNAFYNTLTNVVLA